MLTFSQMSSTVVKVKCSGNPQNSLFSSIEFFTLPFRRSSSSRMLGHSDFCLALQNLESLPVRRKSLLSVSSSMSISFRIRSEMLLFIRKVQGRIMFFLQLLILLQMNCLTSCSISLTWVFRLISQNSRLIGLPWQGTSGFLANSSLRERSVRNGFQSLSLLRSQEISPGLAEACRFTYTLSLETTQPTSTRGQTSLLSWLVFRPLLTVKQQQTVSNSSLLQLQGSPVRGFHSSNSNVVLSSLRTYIVFPSGKDLPMITQDWQLALPSYRSIALKQLHNSIAWSSPILASKNCWLVIWNSSVFSKILQTLLCGINDTNLAVLSMTLSGFSAVFKGGGSISQRNLLMNVLLPSRLLSHSRMYLFRFNCSSQSLACCRKRGSYSPLKNFLSELQATELSIDGERERSIFTYVPIAGFSVLSSSRSTSVRIGCWTEVYPKISKGLLILKDPDMVGRLIRVDNGISIEPKKVRCFLIFISIIVSVASLFSSKSNRLMVIFLAVEKNICSNDEFSCFILNGKVRDSFHSGAMPSAWLVLRQFFLQCNSRKVLTLWILGRRSLLQSTFIWPNCGPQPPGPRRASSIFPVGLLQQGQLWVDMFGCCWNNERPFINPIVSSTCRAISFRVLRYFVKTLLAFSRVGTLTADAKYRVICSSLTFSFLLGTNTFLGPSFLFCVNRSSKKTTMGETICSKVYSLTISSTSRYLYDVATAPVLTTCLLSFILFRISFILLFTDSGCWLNTPSRGLQVCSVELSQIMLAWRSWSITCIRSWRLRMASSVKGIFLPCRLLFLLRILRRNCLVDITPSKGSTDSLLVRSACMVCFLPIFLCLSTFLGSFTSMFSSSSSGTLVSAVLSVSSDMVMLLGGILAAWPFHSILQLRVPTYPLGSYFFFRTASPFEAKFSLTSLLSEEVMVLACSPGSLRLMVSMTLLMIPSFTTSSFTEEGIVYTNILNFSYTGKEKYGHDICTFELVLTTLLLITNLRKYFSFCIYCLRAYSEGFISSSFSVTGTVDRPIQYSVCSPLLYSFTDIFQGTVMEPCAFLMALISFQPSRTLLISCCTTSPSLTQRASALAICSATSSSMMGLAPCSSILRCLPFNSSMTLDRCGSSGQFTYFCRFSSNGLSCQNFFCSSFMSGCWVKHTWPITSSISKGSFWSQPHCTLFWLLRVDRIAFFWYTARAGFASNEMLANLDTLSSKNSRLIMSSPLALKYSWRESLHSLVSSRCRFMVSNFSSSLVWYIPSFKDSSSGTASFANSFRNGRPSRSFSLAMGALSGGVSLNPQHSTCRGF